MKLTPKMKADMAAYQPCHLGIHVCGISRDEDNPITVANFPTRTAAEARRLFAAAKAECEAGGDEPGDFVIDLNVGLNEMQVEDFMMSRQMLDRLTKIAGEL